MFDRSGAYSYSSQPTRNPLRWLLAAWRVSRDLTNTDEAAIVEIGFSRSRFGRRYAGWDVVAAKLASDPRTAGAMNERQRIGVIDLGKLAALPERGLGSVFASHCAARGLNPNLADLSADDPGEFVMAHLLDSHDIWHVVTGWGNDEIGEVGLGAFYLGQMSLPLIALMLALILLNTIFSAPGTLRERMDALVAGYQMGRDAEPLFGTQWDAHWETPLAELRGRFGLRPEDTLGEGIPAAD